MRKGFSNVKLSNAKCNKNCDNLLDLALTILNEKYPIFLEKEKINFPFETDTGHKVKVTVKGGDSGTVKRTSSGNHVITLDIYSDTKEEIFSTFIHEITHISQYFNGFDDYDLFKDWENFRELSKKNKKLTYSYYYGELSHSRRGTEKEAKLVQVMKFLEDDQINNAYDLLLFEPEYFTFDFRTFVKKVTLFGINDIKIVYSLKELVINKLNEVYLQCQEGFKTNIGCLGDFYSYLKAIMPILRMLNINTCDYVIWVRKNLKGNVEKFNNDSWLYNWGFILQECDKLSA